MSKNVRLFGNFGSQGQVNGQTIKTREVFSLLAGLDVKLRKFDSSQFGILHLFMSILTSRDDVEFVCFGKRGLFIYCFISCILFRFDRKRIFVAVGGWLPDVCQNRVFSFFLRPLTKRSVFLVESTQIVKFLNANSYEAGILANFRSNTCAHAFRYKTSLETLRLIFVSRLIPEKGLMETIELAKFLHHAEQAVELDIFGVGDEEYIRSIMRAIAGAPFIRFLGSLPPNDVVGKISEYHFLVLPTSYPGECMPGVVVEAYASSTPVLTTNWCFMPEMVIDGKTGFVSDLSSFVDDTAHRLLKLSPYDFDLMQRATSEFFAENYTLAAAHDAVVDALNSLKDN